MNYNIVSVHFFNDTKPCSSWWTVQENTCKAKAGGYTRLLIMLCLQKMQKTSTNFQYIFILGLLTYC